MRRKAISVLLLFFIALAISCTNNSKEGFPLYGIRIGDSPEQVEAILLKAGYTKNTESLSENFISLIFISNENRIMLVFKDKKLDLFSSEIGNKNFEVLISDLRTNLGYPSYYSSTEEKAEWTIKNKPIITKLDLIRNSSGRYVIGMIRDRMAEIDEGWY